MSFVVIWCYLTFLMLYNVVLCHLLSLYDILLNNFQPLFGLDNPWLNSFREANNCMFQDILLSFTDICCQVFSSHQWHHPFCPKTFYKIPFHISYSTLFIIYLNTKGKLEVNLTPLHPFLNVSTINSILVEYLFSNVIPPWAQLYRMLLNVK